MSSDVTGEDPYQKWNVRILCILGFRFYEVLVLKNSQLCYGVHLLKCMDWHTVQRKFLRKFGNTEHVLINFIHILMVVEYMYSTYTLSLIKIQI